MDAAFRTLLHGALTAFLVGGTICHAVASDENGSPEPERVEPWCAKLDARQAGNWTTNPATAVRPDDGLFPKDSPVKIWWYGWKKHGETFSFRAWFYCDGEMAGLPLTRRFRVEILLKDKGGRAYYRTQHRELRDGRAVDRAVHEVFGDAPPFGGTIVAGELREFTFARSLADRLAEAEVRVSELTPSRYRDDIPRPRTSGTNSARDSIEDERVHEVGRPKVGNGDATTANMSPAAKPGARAGTPRPVVQTTRST